MQRVTRLFIFLTLLALIFGAQAPHPVQAAGTWETVGSANIGRGSTFELSVATENEIPYVAYNNEIFGEADKLTVIKFDGTDWVTIGNEQDMTYSAWDLSIDVDNQVPFVAYTDLGFKPTVKKFNGIDWEVVGVESFSDGETSNLSPIVVDNGTPYIAYEDWDHGYNYIVKKFDGTSWVDVGSTGVSSDLSPGGSSLGIENGVLYLAFSDASKQNKATVIKFNGTDWEIVGEAGFSLGSPLNISLVFDNGVPFVAYSDSSNGSKATVMKFNGTDWVTVGAPGFSVGNANDISIEINNGQPYVAFKDSANSGGATVMKFNGSNWVTVGLPDFSNGSTQDLDLKLINGVPLVAFSGGDYDDVTVLKFNSSTNAPPTDITLSNDHVPQNLPVGTTVGQLAAIDADPGDPHVYALACAVPGADDLFFKIGGLGNDQLQTTAVFDYNTKNSYEICVQTDDGSEGVYEKNFTVHVTTTLPSKVGFRSIGVNDGWILEHPNGNNRGGLVDGAGIVFRVGDNELNREYRSILAFNTISLPDNAIIFRVTLKIKKQAVVGTNPYSQMGKLLVDINAPYFGASAALAKPDFQSPADMKNIGDIPNYPASDWNRKVWSVDKFFSLINRTGRTQFRLYFANGNNWNDTADYIDFYSGDYSVITDRPMLIVEYYVP